MDSFAFMLFLADASPIQAVLAGISAINAVGIFGLIFHVGRYTGRQDEWKQSTDTRMKLAEQAVLVLHTQELTQVRLNEMVAGVQRDLSEHRAEMKDEISLLRKRTHELAGVMHKVLLKESLREEG